MSAGTDLAGVFCVKFERPLRVDLSKSHKSKVAYREPRLRSHEEQLTPDSENRVTHNFVIPTATSGSRPAHH